MTAIEPSDLDPSDVVIQPRCPHCGIEHYCLNVPAQAAIAGTATLAAVLVGCMIADAKDTRR